MRKTWVRRRLPSANRWGAGAEIDLGLFPGSAFQTAEGKLLRHLQLGDEAADAVVAAGEAVFGHQVLVDALGTESQLQLGLDERTPGQTVAGPTSALGDGGCRRGMSGRPEEPMRHWLVLTGRQAAAEPMGALAGFEARASPR